MAKVYFETNGKEGFQEDDSDDFKKDWFTTAWGRNGFTGNDGKEVIFNTSRRNKNQLSDLIKAIQKPENADPDWDRRIFYRPIQGQSGEVEYFTPQSVTEVQEFLKNHGAKDIQVDGIAGAQTASVLQEYVNRELGKKGWETPGRDKVYKEDPNSKGYLISEESITDPQYYRTVSKQDIKSLGFKNYSTLVDSVKNHPNNPVSILTKKKFGNDPDKWNQNDVEGTLGISGTYYSFGGGDYGDMMRSLNKHASELNGEAQAISHQPMYNRSEIRDYMRDTLHVNPYDYDGYQRKALRHYLNGNYSNEELRNLKQWGFNSKTQYFLGSLLFSLNYLPYLK